MRSIMTLLFGLSVAACIASDGAARRQRFEDTPSPPDARAGSGPDADDDPKKCPSGNNGDCTDAGDARWCTHCRDGKKIEKDAYFCATEADHQQHEKGCTGED